MSETRHRLDPLFRPRSVAVVGASPKGGYGLTTLQNLRGVGFDGDVFVVHPRLNEVDGVTALRSLRDLPQAPDAVAVAVPARSVPAVLREAAEIGAGGAVVYASGFGELGERGQEIQSQLEEVADLDFPFVGPNCLGLASYRGRAALWGITLPFVHASGDGTVALAAQSGNMSLTTMLSGRLPAVAYGASLGNQTQVDVADCLQYYLTDPGVRVVGLIIEGLADLQRFRALALQAAEADVAVVALKVGRSAKGVAAAVAHTGTLAGGDGAYDALFRQTGVIRVDDLDEMIAVCSLLEGSRRPSGRSLGVFASSGGECGLVADLADQVSVPIGELSTDTEKRLREVLPEYGYVSNPFDLTAGGWGQLDVYATTSHALAIDPAVDVVAFVGDAPTYSGSLQESGWPAMVGGAGKTAAEVDVPVALITTTTDTDPGLPQLCQQNGVVFMAGVRPALRAIALAGKRAEQIRAIRRGTAPASASVDGEARDKARALLAGHRDALSETLSKAVLREYGIAVPDGGSAADAEAAAELADRIGFPVAVKIEADGLAHKSDVGGVEVGLRDAAAVRAAAQRVLARVADAVGHDAITGFRVERAANLDGATELIIGGRNDDSSSVVVVGAGGVLTELVSDAVTLLWPFSPDDVESALTSLRVNTLLRGYRGGAPADRDALVDVVMRVGRLLNDLPEVTELDVNPLMCAASGRGALALDALVVVNHDRSRGH